MTLAEVGDEYVDAAGHSWRVQGAAGVGHDIRVTLGSLECVEGKPLECDNRTMVLSGDDPRWNELRKVK